MSSMIEGVVVRNLKTHSDERGYFRELIRVTDDFFAEGFGQWSHSLMFNGVTKAWHYHKILTTNIESPIMTRKSISIG